MLGRIKSELTERLQSTRPGDGGDALLPESVLRRLEKRSLSTGRTLGGGLAGEHRGRRLAASHEFADYRPYTPGDDFRRIDWNAYARLNNLLVRIPEAREDITLHLLLDASRSMDFGEPSKLRYARQVCAGLGYMALSRLDAVRVGVVGGSLAGRSQVFRGKLQTRQLFQFVQRFPLQAQTNLNLALPAYLERCRPTDVAVVVSDLLSPAGHEQGLMRLLQAGLGVAVVHVLSPEELEPDYFGDLELVDVESGDSVQVSLGEEALKRYRQEVAAWQEGVRTFCRSHGITYIAVRTDTPIEQTLLADFRYAGLLN